jgi:hypothetical protein
LALFKGGTSLGFKELVNSNPNKVDDLFEIIASLNVHRHSAFAAVVFSDTILVHNVVSPRNDHDRQYFVMYQCEFYRDLMHRIAGRSIALRGTLTYGPFEHYRLNNIPYYYGKALIRAYESQKKMKLTGLLMDKHCHNYNRIFSSRPFDQDWSYIFVTQALDAYEDVYGAAIPLPECILEDTDLSWVLGPELEILAYSKRQAKESIDAEVRRKHIKTLDMYRERYPRIFKALEASNFKMEAINPSFDWTKVRERMKEKYSWASIKNPPKPGS